MMEKKDHSPKVKAEKKCSWAIYTSAMDMLGGAGVEKQCRKTDILADAAYCILTKPKSFTGNFVIDEILLREEGIKNFDPYAVAPGHPLLPDFFLDVDPDTLAMKMEAQGENFLSPSEILQAMWLEIIDLRLVKAAFGSETRRCVTLHNTTFSDRSPFLLVKLEAKNWENLSHLKYLNRKQVLINVSRAGASPTFKEGKMQDVPKRDGPDKTKPDGPERTGLHVHFASENATGPVANTFKIIKGAINEDVVKSTQGVYRFELSGEEGGTWYIDLRNKGGSAGSGEPPGKVDVIMSMSSSDFVKMFSGKLKPTMAFMSGKLTIKGDMALAIKLEKLMGQLNAKL
ncbi:Hydroxysteroid dehydrogenase-like protein 2 [Varanus komodoensis]|nr:Hydroxysteroid dehydrogenase-like protein 2 [Varanus komodoensis]